MGGAVKLGERIVNLTVSDIQIGAIEIKDGATDRRATVTATLALKVDGSAVTQPVSGPLTDTELRATPVPVSGTVSTGGLTDTELRATPVPVSGTVTATGPLTDTELRATAVPVSGPLTDTELRATAVPVSGPLTDTELRTTAVPISGTVTATGPLTDTELRATAVPVSGSFLTDTELRATAVPISGTVTATGPLTDTELRATAVPVSGPLTDTELRATPVPVSGTVSTGGLTDTELRATAVPVSGPLTDTELRATAVPVSGTVTATGPLTDTELRATAVPISQATASSLNAQTVGELAHDTADTGNPIKIGGKAITAAVAAVAGNDRVNAMFTKTGKLVTSPYAPRELVIQNNITLANTTETTLLATGGAGVYHDLTLLILSNTSGTAVRVDLRDDTGSTVRISVMLAATGGGALVVIALPIKQTADDDNWTAQLSGVVTDVRIFAQAIKEV